MNFCAQKLTRWPA